MGRPGSDEGSKPISDDERFDEQVRYTHALQQVRYTYYSSGTQQVRYIHFSSVRLKSGEEAFNN